MKVLIIGLGSIGKRHLGNLVKLGVESTDITIVEPREDRQAQCEQLGVEQIYESIDLALKQGKYDLGIICSPTNLHIDQGVALASHGVNIFMEKPLSNDSEGLDRFREVVNNNRVAVLMGYVFRFSPLTRKVVEILKSDPIGKVYYLRGEFSEYLPDWHPYEDYRSFYMAEKSQGGGSILDQSHIFDLVHFLFGKYRSVYAVNSTISNLEINSDDIAEIIASLESGVVVSLHTDLFGRDHKKNLEIFGEKGNIRWDFYTNSVSVFDGESRSRVIYEKFPKDFNEVYLDEMRHFIDCCQNGATPLASLDDGIHTMKFIAGAEKSSRDKSVELL